MPHIRKTRLNRHILCYWQAFFVNQNGKPRNLTYYFAKWTTESSVGGNSCDFPPCVSGETNATQPKCLMKSVAHPFGLKPYDSPEGNPAVPYSRLKPMREKKLSRFYLTHTQKTSHLRSRL